MTPSDPLWDDDFAIGLYIGQFAPRTDLYVANGAEVIRKDLTPDVIRHAVAHHYAISAYLGTPDGRTHVGAIDFDDDDGLDQARQVQHLLEQHRIPSLVVGSRRGAHLWVTCADWSNVGTMRRAMRAAVLLATGAEDPKCEVFPKQQNLDSVGALRLPGMPHQRTQQVYPIYRGAEVFTDLTFEAVIDAVSLTSAATILKFAGRNPVPIQYPKASSLGAFTRTRWRGATNGDTPKASDVLNAIWGLQIKPGSTGRCPKHDDRHGSLTVYKDDQRVFCGSTSCLLNGGGHGVGSIELARMKA